MAVAQLRVFVPAELPTCIGFSDVIREGGGRILNPNSGCRFQQRRKIKQSLFSLFTNYKYACVGQEPEKDLNLSVYSSLVAHPAGDVAISSEQKVSDVVVKQAALVEQQLRKKEVIKVKKDMVVPGTNYLLKEAYDRCGEVCAEYAKTFYLGTLLMTAERRKAIWAIYVWCRRTDELVDGPNATHITPSALDRWQARLEDVFEGRPYDMLDAALSDTVTSFPVDIQACGLMSVPVMGIAPESKATTESVYNAALALGIANQLTNILRDVGEDVRRGRVYLPQDELAMAGLSDEDIFKGKVTDRWRNFMKNQIKRARVFFQEAEKGVNELSQASRWPVLASLLLYRQILDEIEANDYDNFTKRAYVSKAKKLMALPMSYGRSLIRSSRKKPELVKL